MKTHLQNKKKPMDIPADSTSQDSLSFSGLLSAQDMQSEFSPKRANLTNEQLEFEFIPSSIAHGLKKISPADRLISGSQLLPQAISCQWKLSQTIDQPHQKHPVETSPGTGCISSNHSKEVFNKPGLGARNAANSCSKRSSENRSGSVKAANKQVSMKQRIANSGNRRSRDKSTNVEKVSDKPGREVRNQRTKKRPSSWFSQKLHQFVSPCRECQAFTPATTANSVQRTL